MFFRLHALFECGVVVVGHSISDKLQNWPLTNSRRGQSTPFGSLSTYQFEVESNLPLRTLHSGKTNFEYLILLFTKIFIAVRYRKVVSINKSCLEATTRFYRLFYEGEIECLFTLTFLGKFDFQIRNMGLCSQL